MSDEKLISGYCRTQDQSRMVLVEYENGELLDADCLYEDCPFHTSCEIAKSIDALLNPNT